MTVSIPVDIEVTGMFLHPLNRLTLLNYHHDNDFMSYIYMCVC